MRCYCCDKLHHSVKIVDKEKNIFMCYKCREEIKHARLYAKWTFIEENPMNVYRTRQDVLTWTGLGNRKTPKPSLKEPDFDLYKGDGDE